MGRRFASDERGAVAVLIALALVVLLGMGALVVDVGALYTERRELQNGADAGALAVAEDCALGNCGDSHGTASALAEANAEDAAAAVDGVTIDMAARTARVDASTRDPDGGTMILYTLARALGLEGSVVRASATARWGPCTNCAALPLTLSRCEFEFAQRLGGEIVLTFHTDQDSQNVNCRGRTPASGLDLPGGFGWLLTEGGCEARLTITDTGTWVGSKPGNIPPAACDPDDVPLGEPILFPVYDQTSGQGTGAKRGGARSEPGRFRIRGYAAMELTGYRLASGGGIWDGGTVPCQHGDPKPAYLGGGRWVGNDTVCIAGRFVRYVELDGRVGGEGLPDFGVRAVELID